MAIKIPVYQTTKEKREGRAPEASFTKPPVDAFGGNVAQAQGQIGDAVQNLGNSLVTHAEQQLEARSQQKAHDASLKYKAQMDDLLYSNKQVKIKGADGQEYDAPSGYMVRAGFQTDQQTIEFQARASEIRKQVLKDMGGGLFGQRSSEYASKMMDTQFVADREKVLSHEAKQMRKAGNDQYDAKIVSKIDEAASAQSPEQLMNIFTAPGGIKEVASQKAQFGGATIEEAQKLSQNYAAKATKNAVDNALRSTAGNLDVAVTFLEAAKGEITTEQYNAIYNQATVGAKSIQQQAKHMQETQQVSAGIAFVGDVIENGKTWEDYDDIEAMNMPDKLKEGVQAMITNENVEDSQPLSEMAYSFDKKNEVFASRIASIMENKSQEEVIDTVTKIMKEKGISLKVDEAEILISMAVQRSKNLQVLNSDAEKNASAKSPELISQDSGYRAVKAWADQTDDKQIYSDYTQFISKGMPAKEALYKANRNAFERLAPDHAMKYEGVPSAVLDNGRLVRMVVPSSLKTEPKMIFEPKTGAIIKNPKYKEPEIEEGKNADNSR